jgi:hypothetical protein
MHFKHPEILYFLLLLIIPIIVHLFQLQRFVKVPFTNVKILKTISQQTRKSARLKKWLILLTRMLAFTSLIMAFSQPYFAKYTANENFITTIYLDNSFSMQAKGEHGEMLKNAAQKIIEHQNFENSLTTIFTNNKNYENLDTKSLKNELITIKYYPTKLDLNTVLLKFNNPKLSKINTSYKNIIISDFQLVNLNNINNFTNVNSFINLVKLKPNVLNNIFVDSVYITSKTSTETVLKVIVKSVENNRLSIPVSLFENSKLIGKTTSKFENNKQSTVQFTIPNTTNFNGKISIIDATLDFDNDFYFSISKPDKVNVMSIGNKVDFLEKIYEKSEFNFSAIELQNLDYNSTQHQHLIILNEIEDIPIELMKNLSEFSEKGGNLVVIPSSKSNINSYNQFLNLLNIGSISSKIETEHKITSINYDHPLMKDVFEKKITNFQYPKSTILYQTNLRNSSSILKFDNNQSFISSKKTINGNFYWVSSPLNNNASDFTKSPLVVPIFYNFAKNSVTFSKLYYTIGPENQIEVKTSIAKDDVLSISNETENFIPLQKVLQNKVIIQLQHHILQSGFYNILSNNAILKTVAFNYNREESDLTSANLESLIANQKNVTLSPSIETLLTELNNQQKINWLFKWFLAFSVLFLLIEMLILKYFKI